MPQGSILGSILFNLFKNDLFLFIKKANLANIAEDNTLYATSKNITSLLEILKSALGKRPLTSLKLIIYLEIPISFKLFLLL